MLCLFIVNEYWLILFLFVRCLDWQDGWWKVNGCRNKMLKNGWIVSLYLFLFWTFCLCVLIRSAGVFLNFGLEFSWVIFWSNIPFYSWKDNSDQNKDFNVGRLLAMKVWGNCLLWIWITACYCLCLIIDNLFQINSKSNLPTDQKNFIFPWYSHGGYHALAKKDLIISKIKYCLKQY